MKFKLINLNLVRKIKDFYKLFFLVVLVIVAILALISSGHNKFSLYVRNNIFWISVTVIVLLFVIPLIIIKLVSKPTYKEFQINENTVTFVSSKEETYKLSELAYVEISNEYHPDVLISFVYSETIVLKALVYKEDLPQIVKILSEKSIRVIEK